MVRHVILADDDEDDCFIFTTAMKELSEKVKVTCLNNCYDLLDYLKKKDHPDMIFLDLNMPGMHGLECLRQMEAKHHVKQTPVVVYSTSSNPENIKNALKHGARSYIIKPDSVPKLKKIIQELWDFTS